MLFSYGQTGNKKYTAWMDRSCAKSLDKTMHNEKFNSWTKIEYWQKCYKEYMERKQRRRKKGEKIKKIKNLVVELLWNFTWISKTAVDAPEEANLLWDSTSTGIRT